jgi:ring-opening amidohydrolase-like protein
MRANAFSALEISSSLAVVGAIVGEFVGATQGLGYLIIISSAHLETATLFSAIFAAAIAGIAMFYVIGWTERRLIFWSNLFSRVASCSAGIELMHNVVIVMGNSTLSRSPFEIGHAVMRDSIDLSAVLAALKSVGLGLADAQLNGRLVNIFAKAEASPDGSVRGFRHTMLDDSDVGSTRHARAAVGGLIGGLSGTGAVYVSGGAEHQGPPGGGPVAVIVRV